ncbi:4a-hydroxytetrahydrobiopterin dehydratase [Paenibacillus antri]|uniref:4a-hydroxytetrahydrobiopterin dehydratase n=1 Tax=Paenibacillus antri TaxID=2582848 RepID=A0A5R9GG18_9BACL|nr:4a-hydroxytetrahydrobiopterin dehydratase [Paenibacillus antri]TLS52328.1 4a-hydroxytetrahydrobiopterin dehydratase [Paenibacillus antri]
MKLTPEEIESRLAPLAGWRREDEKWIVKKYRFSSYLDGIAFVARVAAEAERLDHHPFIAIEYKLITLRLTSWHAGGLTALDFEAAEAFDRAAWAPPGA